MRKRQIKKQFWLSNIENKKLKKNSELTGLCESDYLRSLINDYYPKEKPPKEFYYILNELRRIGNNVNQIAKIANKTNYIDEKILYNVIGMLKNLINDLISKYLKPDRK